MYHLRLNNETAWQEMQQTLYKTLNQQCVQFFFLSILPTECVFLKERNMISKRAMGNLIDVEKKVIALQCENKWY